MLQFIKNIFKDKEKEQMQKLLRDLAYKAHTRGRKEIVTGYNGRQLVFTVRIPESFIQECAKHGKKDIKKCKANWTHY